MLIRSLGRRSPECLSIVSRSLPGIAGTHQGHDVSVHPVVATPALHAYRTGFSTAAAQKGIRATGKPDSVCRGFSAKGETNDGGGGKHTSSGNKAKKTSSAGTAESVKDEHASAANRLSSRDSAKSCDQQKYAPPHDAGSQQEDHQDSQPATKYQSAEHANSEQQQQQQTAKDVLQEDARWRGSEMEQRFQEGLEHLAGQNTIERHVREDPTWTIISLWNELVAAPIRRKWLRAVMRTCTVGFNQEELSEGCLDACHMVLKLWSECEWKLLESMISAKLLKVLRQTSEDYTSNNLSLRMETEGDFRASLQNVEFLSPAGLLRYAEKPHEAPQPEPGTEAPASDKSGFESWNTLASNTVVGDYARTCRWHVVLTIAFHGSIKATEVNAGGQVVREIIDKQPKRWRFYSSSTLALNDFQFMRQPPFRVEKVDASEAQQWGLLEIG